jgi:hypothetical protein
VTVAKKSSVAGAKGNTYQLRISQLTIDKLGVKLYDRVSAVVAELVSNAYDADATRVDVRLPLATLLSVPAQGGPDWTVVVTDDGHGLTPEEAQRHYLRVGADRRGPGGMGAKSRKLKRPVMGRKGIGKLAPFGICGRIEVVSSGGPKTSKGFLTSHFILDFDKIMAKDVDTPVELDTGALDGAYSKASGTTITLSRFLPKRVPDQDTFMRQLERRFALADPSFEVWVQDTRHGAAPFPMQTFAVPIVEETKIDLAARPVPLEDGSNKPVTGWVAMAREAYKNEEMAGVRIYARGKIVATTRDFEQPAGYTGEFATRSYLVGEIHADWLDDDAGDDLIRTDRQSILWESELGSSLRAWGAELTKEIGRRSRDPRRDIVRKKFREVAQLEARARARYQDESVIQMALNLGDRIGGFAAEDELNDEEYVNGLVEVILSVAPHQALITAFQEFGKQRTGGKEPTLDSLLDLFSKSRIAEAASYAQLATERLQVLDELDEIIFDTARDEAALQRIITDAPWLIQPDWTVITANQSLKTFKIAFEKFLKQKHGLDVQLAIEWEGKRPDFVLVAVGGMLHLVEIKASGHAFDDPDAERLFNYVDALQEFFENNREMAKEFPRRWRIDLVVDSLNLKKANNKQAFTRAQDSGEVLQLSWNDFRARARKTHEQFLDVRDAAKTAAKKALPGAALTTAKKTTAKKTTAKKTTAKKTTAKKTTAKKTTAKKTIPVKKSVLKKITGSP